MKVVRFAVGIKPCCVWDPDPLGVNREFLASVNPEYYEYLVRVHSPGLDDPEVAQYSAAALRIAYSQALESLFAMLAAVAQAPDCVYGWLLKYRMDDLTQIVRDISAGTSFYNRFHRVNLSWKFLSTTIHPSMETTAVSISDVQEGFALLWSRLADDFLAWGQREEYNSFKHGTRARLGGFSVTVSNRGKGIRIPGSDFGSSYPYLASIRKDQCNYTLGRASRKWGPSYICNSLNLMSYSISNIISFLMVENGGPRAEATIHYPDDLAVFTDLWTPEYQVQESRWERRARDDAPLLSPEQILAAYDQGDQEPHGA